MLDGWEVRSYVPLSKYVSNSAQEVLSRFGYMLTTPTTGEAKNNDSCI